MTPTFANASNPFILQHEPNGELQAGRTALVQLLANRAAAESPAGARTALLSVLAQRHAQSTNEANATRQSSPRDFGMPTDWMTGERSLLDREPTTWRALFDMRPAVQSAGDVWQAERDAIPGSVRGRVRFAAILVALAGLMLGIIVLIIAA